MILLMDGTISIVKKGVTDVTWLPDFFVDEGFLIQTYEQMLTSLAFLFIFLTDEVLVSIVLETNKYATNYIEKEKAADRLSAKSKFRSWPVDGIRRDQLEVFIALTFYFGVVKKDNVKSYWSTDDIFNTPFPRTFIKRDEFFNIFFSLTFVTMLLISQK